MIAASTPLCSVAGCDAAPCSEFPLPEGYIAVACEPHKRTVEGWMRAPIGAPRGSRLIGHHVIAPPPQGASVLRLLECDDAGAVTHKLTDARARR